MSASTPSQSERKEDHRTTLLVLAGASIALFYAGFSSGWKRGRMDLLISLNRATRIQRHLAKEE